jgi:PAS domain S-box-containing protein
MAPESILFPSARAPSAAATAVDGALDDPQAARLLRYIAVLFIVAGSAVLAINLLVDGRMRLAAPLGVLSGLLALGLVSAGHLTWAARLLCAALLAVGPLGAYTTATGLSSPSWGLSAMAAMAGGWLLGRQAALLLAALATCCALGFYLWPMTATDSTGAAHEVLLATVLVSVWVGALLGRATASNFMQRQVQLLSDQSDRLRAARDALQKSDQQLRAVLNHLQGGIYVLDIETQRPLFVSEVMCQLYGYGREQLMSLPPNAFFPPDRMEGMLRRLDQAMLGRVPVEHGVHLLRQDGTIFVADVRHTLVELDQRQCLLSHISPSLATPATPA